VVVFWWIIILKVGVLIVGQVIEMLVIMVVVNVRWWQ